MKRAILLFLCFLLMGMTAVNAQMKTITGKVVSSEDNSPIPGVSVILKGTTVGTVTNMDGVYSVQVPGEGKSLIFSFVGYRTQEILLEGKSKVDVVLQVDVLNVDEVVVTALGISKEKKSLGYTVQDIKGAELVQGANPDLMTSLSGKIAGLEVRQSSGMPGAPSQTYIRGARAFSGNNAPLYVIDGMPVTSDNDYGSNVTGSAYANRAIDIDPNDIESVNVLKGQAAAALYGLRASNGVIIITTKKGKNSPYGKPVVNISSNVIVDVVSRLPEVQQTYAQGTLGVFGASNSYTWGPKISDLPKAVTYGGDNYTDKAGLFFDPYKGAWVNPQAYNNPENFFSKNGYTYSNSINISNSTSIGNYSIGLGSTNQNGIVNETGMDRYTAKAAGDFKLNDHWTMGFSANFSDVKIKKIPSGNDSWLFAVYGAPASFDLMGTPFHQEGTFGPYRQISYRAGVGVNPRWATVNNHYWEATKRFFGNTYFEYKPLSWMNVKYQLGIDNYTNDNENYQEMGHSNIATGTQLPTPNNPVYTFVQPTGGSKNNFGVTKQVINSLLTVNLNHEFFSLFKTNLLLGNEIDNNKSEFYSLSGSNFTTPGWNSMSNASVQTATHNKYNRRTAGFFGNLSVDFQSMLFFNATGRYDIVSSMPRGNRGFFYPSASLGFVFTELNPLKNNDFLSFGKLRASYAEVGQAADTYLPDPIYVTGGAGSGFLNYGITYPFGGLTGYKNSRTIYDTNLKPQNTTSVELGIELKFLKNRFGLDYSYFVQDAVDQIFSVPLAGATGYGSLVMNAGHMESKGHEVILTATPLDFTNLKWNITANFTKTVNTVIELAPGVDNISLGGYTTPNIRASAGDTYPTIYGEQFVKDKQGRILVNENSASPYYGMPQIGPFGKIGDVSPDFIVGFNNDFKFFNLVSIFANAEWKQGGHMYSGSNRLMDLYGMTKKTEARDKEFIYPGFKADGTPNDIKRGGSTDLNAYQTLQTSILSSLPEAQIYETSYVKIREVGANITIPKKWTETIKLSKVVLGFSARNILLWTTLPNFDPETSQGQGNMQGGMDYMSLPQTTSYGFNLNLIF
jgi:TonB-linked SusC/RagA family outer membrane protein